MRLSDLGLGGGYIDTPAQVAVGDEIRVAFTLGGEAIICPARVAHVQPSIGFGFAFLGELDEPIRVEIEKFVSS